MVATTEGKAAALKAFIDADNAAFAAREQVWVSSEDKGGKAAARASRRKSELADRRLYAAIDSAVDAGFTADVLLAMARLPFAKEGYEAHRARAQAA